MSKVGPILCVEDDEDDQYLIEQLLRELGVTNPIEFFGDGQQALTYLEKTREQPFLILCDINMPRMNGIELRQRIDANWYLRKKAIPFIFLTTAGEDRLVELAYTSTIQGFFQKAHGYEDLKQQLNRIVNYWRSCSHPHTLFD